MHACKAPELRNHTTHPNDGGGGKGLVGDQQHEPAIVFIDDVEVIVAKQNAQATLRNNGVELGQAMVGELEQAGHGAVGG